ncbi:MAG: hypothetical protein LLG44_08900 [Chloroflexi bacterium]|nr:hypothetical protein [Chloroflexota bacterium]
MEFPPLGMIKQTGFNAGFSVTMRYFPDNNPEHVRSVVTAMFELWRPLIERAQSISVGLTIGNGEHIYRWTGNLDDEFEWDHYKGHNNQQYAHFSFDPIPLRPFKENWFHFTYRDLQLIIRVIKQTAQDMFGLPLTIGSLCEPGPEFCESLFRYVWHPEVVSFMGGGHGVSIDYKSTLHADTRQYGAYPCGIPEGEPFGRFLGKQVAHFSRVMDIQNISFSNGLGFGTYPWNLVGRNFDGTHFGLASYTELAADILDFWLMYKNEAPVQKVSAQGSNWPVGIDLAAKGVPLKDLYDRRLLDFPLGYTVSVFFDDSVGFAMAANMSRIAHAPNWDLSFYLHDPWYPQNPWEDFPYDRNAFDLYAPASISLIGAEGELIKPYAFGTFMHDENANLQPETVRSFMPHLETALDHLADQVGPLTWLYPFQEYHSLMAACPEQADTLWFGDAFTAKAIDAGLPLNSVVSTEYLAKALETGVLDGTILYTPVPPASASYWKPLTRWIDNGGQVMFYGPLNHADQALLDLLGLQLSTPLEGELDFSWKRMDLVPKPVRSGRQLLKHAATTSAGGVCEVLQSGAGSTVLATVAKGEDTRVYALSTRQGKVSWCRGTTPFEITGGQWIANHDISKYVNGARLPRLVLAAMGWQIDHLYQTPEQRDPQGFISRHRNAFIMNGYKPDNTVEYALKFPDGAPIFTGDDTLLIDGRAHYHLDKSYRKECRVFVQQQSGRIQCRKTLNHEFSESEIAINGLQDAQVTLYLPLDKIEGAYIRQPSRQTTAQDTAEGAAGQLNCADVRQGDKLVLKNLSGSLVVRW